MSELTNFLDNWYPTRLADRLLIIADIEKMWEEFKPYTDATCLKEFTSGEENKFQERYWEVFLGSCFMRQGLKLSPPPKTTGGPDFRIEHNGRVIWIEAITASPGIQNNQVPDISPSHGIASRVPSEEILLRYTAAIKEKYEKYSERYLNKIIGSSPSRVGKL